MLMPGANLTSYGAVRDIEKWPARDRREVRRDTINFEEYNPYVTGAMLRAVDTLHSLEEGDPDAAEYGYNKTMIRAAALRRGLKLYNKAIVAALGAMLGRGASSERYDGGGRWIDAAGQYITLRETEAILDAIDREGRYVIRPEYEIVDYDPAQSVVRVRQHGRWALFDYLGRRLTEFGEADDREETD